MYQTEDKCFRQITGAQPVAWPAVSPIRLTIKGRDLSGGGPDPSLVDPNLASLWAIATSLIQASPNPPPNTAPSITAITVCGARLTLGDHAAKLSVQGLKGVDFWFYPGASVHWPCPDIAAGTEMTLSPTQDDCTEIFRVRIDSNTPISSCTICRLMALRLCGRFR